MCYGFDGEPHSVSLKPHGNSNCKQSYMRLLQPRSLSFAAHAGSDQILERVKPGTRPGCSHTQACEQEEVCTRLFTTMMLTRVSANHFICRPSARLICNVPDTLHANAAISGSTSISSISGWSSPVRSGPGFNEGPCW